MKWIRLIYMLFYQLFDVPSLTPFLKRVMKSRADVIGLPAQPKPGTKTELHVRRREEIWLLWKHRNCGILY